MDSRRESRDAKANSGEDRIDKLPFEAMEDLREAFSMCDQDGDGEITIRDLGQVMRNLGYNFNGEQLKWIMEVADDDGSGTIDFSEFVQLLVKEITKRDNRQVFVDAFKVFDSDGDGYIDRNELSAILTAFGQRLSDREVDWFIKSADYDGDGQIDLEEFINIMTAGTG